MRIGRQPLKHMITLLYLALGLWFAKGLLEILIGVFQILIGIAQGLAALIIDTE